MKLWNVASGRLLRSFVGHADHVNSVTFSPDGRLALSGDSETLKLWDIGNGRLIRSLTGHEGSIVSIAFSPDGLTALSAATTTP